MSDTNFTSVMDSLLKGVDSVISTKTVVGEPKQIGDTIILPLVDVSFGMGAGAKADGSKNSASGGMGGKMSPSAVLVINNGVSRIINIKNQDTVSKLVDMAPDIIARFANMIKKDGGEKLTDEEIIAAATENNEN